MVKVNVCQKLVILTIFISLVFAGCKTHRSSTIPPAKRAQTAVAGLDLLKQKAMVTREIGIKSLENAYSALNEAQRLYLKALQSYSYSEIEFAYNELTKIQLDVDNTVKKVNELSRLTAEAISLANNAMREAQLASNALTSVEAENAADKAEQMSKSVRNNTEKAILLVEELKKRWLLPPFIENKKVFTY